MAPSTAHTPMRSCKACRKKLPKSQFQRWVISADQPKLDEKQNIAGRGTYFCSMDCYNSIKGHLTQLMQRRR
ncbi:DUF448 domain-containing protein [Candidatus Saccharibacteria bacterium]|nr:DUF448 domain-containing protein [Candidatus Saccharibacteria bacterium]